MRCANSNWTLPTYFEIPLIVFTFEVWAGSTFLKPDNHRSRESSLGRNADCTYQWWDYQRRQI